jgi:hypothetical protein
MTTCNGSRVILDSDECLIQEEEAQLAAERAQGHWTPDPVLLRQAQKAAGELLWLATRTRVDLAYTMHRLCSVVSSNPARAVRMQKRVLRYLKMTSDVGVLFTSRAYLLQCEGAPETPLAEHYLERVLVGYSDASFAPEGGKSHQGIILTLGGVPVFWKSPRQTIVALSTAESELIAAVDVYVAQKGLAELLV